MANAAVVDEECSGAAGCGEMRIPHCTRYAARGVGRPCGRCSGHAAVVAGRVVGRAGHADGGGDVVADVAHADGEVVP